MARAQSNRPSPWLKRVLVPFWIVQLGFMFFLLIILIISAVDDPSDFAVIVLLIIILSAVSIVLNVTEIILFARRQLQPLAYLILQCVKTTVWSALFIDGIVRGIVLQGGESSRINTSYTYGVIIFGILFFAFLGSLIYSSIIYHRHRINKRKGLGSNITQNPYYQGPYSEAGITTANYQALPSPSPYTSAPLGDGSMYRGETVKGHYVESGGYTAVPPELASTEVHGEDTVRELPTDDREVFELATAKTWKSSRNGA